MFDEILKDCWRVQRHLIKDYLRLHAKICYQLENKPNLRSYLSCEWKYHEVSGRLLYADRVLLLCGISFQKQRGETAMTIPVLLITLMQRGLTKPSLLQLIRRRIDDLWLPPPHPKSCHQWRLSAQQVPFLRQGTYRPPARRVVAWPPDRRSCRCSLAVYWRILDFVYSWYFHELSSFLCSLLPDKFGNEKIPRGPPIEFWAVLVEINFIKFARGNFRVKCYLSEAHVSGSLQLPSLNVRLSERCSLWGHLLAGR